jgi:DNA-binding XRE family transcriptional regulator
VVFIMNKPAKNTALIAARLAAGLSVTDAAALIGASRRAWVEWEAGRRNMPPAKFSLFEMYVATLLTAPH